jgi:hypothetical protein
VQSLAVNEKFPYAEVTADGNVRGWSDRSEALVLFFPTPEPDRFQVIALTTSNTPEEAARLGVAIVAHVSSTADDPKNPTRVVPKDGKLPARPTTLTWKSAEHAATPVLRYFGTASALVLEKKGFSTQAPPTAPLAFGMTKEKQVVAFLGTTAKGHTCGIHVVVATVGDETAEKLTDDILAQVVKMLFD